jgi:chaperonin GroEL
MARAIEVILASIRAQSKQAKKGSLAQVARTAAGGNSQVANLVVEAFSRVGRDGIVVIERNRSPQCVLELQEGMSLDRGIIDEGFFQPTEVGECTLEDAYVLACEQSVSSMLDILPLLEEIARAKRPLLLIAGNVEGEALATLIVNRKRGTLDCLAIKAPGYADRRRAILQDIAALTGGNAITLSSGQSLASVAIKDLGTAKKIIVGKSETTILGGAGEANISKHLDAIREELARTINEFDAEKLRERMARLSGAIASVRVGGDSEQDISDNVYAAESAMHSVQTAIEEGVVAGGGVSLFHSKEGIKRLGLKKPGEVAGVLALTEAIEQPLRQLLGNSGADTEGVLGKLKRSKNPRMGFNVETSKSETLDEAGVLDPVATITHAVQLAYSHARPLLATAAWDSTSVKTDPTVSQTLEPRLEGDALNPPDHEKS